jgi:sugar lactone lactonase YvrE
MSPRVPIYLAAVGLLLGCSKSSGPTAGSDGGADGGPMTTQPDGGGGDSVTAPSAGNGTIRELTPAAMGGAMFTTPFDATLSPDGKIAYFTALNPEGDGAAIFQSAAPSDGQVKVLASGAPLSAPVGLDITSDGKTLVIADPAADGEADDGRGELFSLPVEGGTPAKIAGASGYAPRGVVVVAEGSGDQIYFTGTIPSERTAGVFRLALAGGQVTTVAKDSAEAPLSDPSGIAVSKGGVVFVVDSAGEDHDRARLLKIEGGSITVLLEDLKVGFPAGLALSQDESTLLVSALEAGRGTDKVIRYNLSTKEVEEVSEGIQNFTESAGLHRAKNADTYIWADSSANGSGTVFVINPQR